MSVAPLRYELDVAIPRSRAFQLFTARVGLWWPRSRSIAPLPQADVVLEPRIGGRWYERDVAGHEHPWGHVLDWVPPERLLLAWQINAAWRYDPDLITEVEVWFEANGARTRLRLEHRNLERLGASAAQVAQQLNGGWPTLLGLFSDLAQSGEGASNV